MIQLKNPMHEEFMYQAAKVVYIYSNDWNSTLSSKAVGQKLCNIGGEGGENFLKMYPDAASGKTC